VSKYFCEFTLREPSRVTVMNGDIVVTEGIDWVTVRDIQYDPGSGPVADLRKVTWNRVQDFLDELNYRYGVALEVSGGATYGPQPEGEFRHFGKYRVKSAPPPESPLPDVESVALQPMDAKRFLRRAEYCTDFLEMFRNVYLAIERATSSYLGGVSMREFSNKLPRVINAAWVNASRDLRKDLEVDHGYAVPENVEPADWLAKKLREEHRLPSFHSRDAGNYRVPYKLEDEDKATRIMYLAETVARRIIAADEAKRTSESP